MVPVYPDYIVQILDETPFAIKLISAGWPALLSAILTCIGTLYGVKLGHKLSSVHEKNAQKRIAYLEVCETLNKIYYAVTRFYLYDQHKHDRALVEAEAALSDAKLVDLSYSYRNLQDLSFKYKSLLDEEVYNKIDIIISSDHHVFIDGQLVLSKDLDNEQLYEFKLKALEKALDLVDKHL